MCGCPESNRPFAYVRCSGIDPSVGAISCGVQPLTLQQYERQLSRPDDLWKCPKCGAPADYDDERSELVQGIE